MRLSSVLLLVASSLLFFSCDSGPGPNESPTVSFSFSPQNPKAGTAVDFTANANDPDGEISTYEWEFGDGESARGPNPTHTFDEQGSFTVNLTVTDDRDGTSSATQTVNVQQRFTQATVTEVEIRDMPFTNDEGQGWDSGSGPDVYYLAFDPNDELLQESTAIDNIGPSDLPISPTGEFTVEDLEGEYAISLRDEDPFNEDDFIGGITFTLEPQIGEYPETVTLDIEDFTFDLSLNWEE